MNMIREFFQEHAVLPAVVKTLAATAIIGGAGAVLTSMDQTKKNTVSIILGESQVVATTERVRILEQTNQAITESLSDIAISMGRVDERTEEMRQDIKELRKAHMRD